MFFISPYSLIGKTTMSSKCKNGACGRMARETRATPAMATLPIGDGRLNPYPFGDAGSSPATATTTFIIFIILSIFLSVRIGG